MKTEIDYKGFKICIEPDEADFNSPDNWGDDSVFLVYDHRNFYVKREGFDPDDIYLTMQDKKALFDGYFYFPVFAYIHSGVSLQLQRYFIAPQGHNEFDVSFKGFALVKREKHSYTREKAYQIAEDLLKTWNDYLSGNIWGFVVKDNNDKEIDSCWGFYGSPEKSGCIDEAKNSIDCEIKRRIKKQENAVKVWITNHIPLDKRSELIKELV